MNIENDILEINCDEILKPGINSDYLSFHIGNIQNLAGYNSNVEGKIELEKKSIDTYLLKTVVGPKTYYEFDPPYALTYLISALYSKSNLSKLKIPNSLSGFGGNTIYFDVKRENLRSAIECMKDIQRITFQCLNNKEIRQFYLNNTNERELIKTTIDEKLNSY